MTKIVQHFYQIMAAPIELLDNGFTDKQTFVEQAQRHGFISNSECRDEIIILLQTRFIAQALSR